MADEKIDLGRELLEALEDQYRGNIRAARANVRVYVENPAGIGEHPDIVEAIETQVAKLAEAEDKLEAVKRHFS